MSKKNPTSRNPKDLVLCKDRTTCQRKTPSLGTPKTWSCEKTEQHVKGKPHLWDLKRLDSLHRQNMSKEGHTSTNSKDSTLYKDFANIVQDVTKLEIAKNSQRTRHTDLCCFFFVGQAIVYKPQTLDYGWDCPTHRARCCRYLVCTAGYWSLGPVALTHHTKPAELLNPSLAVSGAAVLQLSAHRVRP